MNHPATTPKTINAFIKASAKSISNHAPVFVPYVEYEGMEKSQCFINVAKLVREQRGKAITGWLFWEWPGVMIDGEHHAIWQKPDGTWEDVTPKADGETSIVFVRDDKAIYANNRSILNKRFASPTNALAKEFIALKREAEMVVEPYRQTGQYGVPGEVMERLQAKESRAMNKWRRLLEKYGSSAKG